jgi:aspartyl-tRNA(Asn)/glutamyl-tRNA(Gln) amidotransferase subunit B
MTESSYTAGDIERVEPIIGMEVHVELATRSKMFTRAPSPAFAGCSRAEEAAPNTLIDAVVLALPGALPVMNRAAVEMSMRVGLALSCQIASVSRWDRKSYFYADLPKAYQLSQYDLPLCFDGAVDVPAIDDRGVFDLSGARTRIGIIRAHLEEDAGKLLHELPGGGRLDGSIVDLNRAGTPLLEIVTQPDFTSAEQCVAFGKLLRMMCRFLGVTEGVMQRGHMRFEPNINCRVHLRGGGVVTTPIVEIKNLNSFRALGEAVAYELREQPRRWLEDGRVMGPGAKSTRGWDAERGVSVLQREKEDAHDYRYFPDPDLPPVFVDGAWLEGVRAGVGEALLSRMDRYAAEAGVGGAEATALAEERGTALLYDEVVDGLAAGGCDRAAAARLAANLLLQGGLRRANERGVAVHELGFTPAQAMAIVRLREAGDISANAMEELLGLCCEDPGAEVRGLARERGLLLVRDEGRLEAWCDEVIAELGPVAQQVREGKVQAVGRLIGAVMARSGGSADAKTVRETLLRKLGGT